MRFTIPPRPDAARLLFDNAEALKIIISGGMLEFSLRGSFKAGKDAERLTAMLSDISAELEQRLAQKLEDFFDSQDDGEAWS